MANVPLTNKKNAILHNQLVAHFMMTGVAIYDDYDEKNPPWEEAPEIYAGTAIFGFKEKADRLLNNLHKLQHIARMISVYRVFLPTPQTLPGGYGQLVHQQFLNMCRRFPTQEGWTNQVRAWEESFITLARSFKDWPHASQVFNCSATTLASIESCVDVAKNTAATLMMQTYGHCGNKELILREAREAIFALEKSWRNDISSGMWLQLTRTRYFQRQEAGDLSLGKGAEVSFPTFRKYFAALRMQPPPSWKPSFEVIKGDAYFAEPTNASQPVQRKSSAKRPNDSENSSHSKRVKQEEARLSIRQAYGNRGAQSIDACIEAARGRMAMTRVEISKGGEN